MQQIKTLRRQGLLDQAYTRAQQLLANNPNDIWGKRSMAWVCYDQMKEAITENNSEVFYAKIENIIELDFNVEQESMLFENIWWLIVKWANTTISPITNNEQRLNAIADLFDAIDNLPRFAPSVPYSRFVNIIHKASKDLLEYVPVMQHINLQLLSPEDYRPSQYSRMALYEQLIYAYSKGILRLQQYYDSNGMTEQSEATRRLAQTHILRMKKALSEQPDYKFTLYYLAKLHTTQGDSSAAINSLMPFVRKNNRDFWVWQTMAVALKDSDLQTAMSCCCMGLLCRAQEDKMVSLHETAAILFAACGHYNAAKREIQIAEEIRVKYWDQHISNQEILNIVAQPKYKEAVANKDNRPFYKEHIALAEQLIYADMTKQILITYVNQEKHIANFIGSDNSVGFFRYKGFMKEHPQSNQLYIAAMEPIDGQKHNLLWCKKVESDIRESSFCKRVQGFVKRIPENKFAFIDNTFISPELVKAYDLQDGDMIDATAIKCFDRKKQIITWSILSINNNLKVKFTL